MSRERRITLFLNAEESEMFDAVRETDLPTGTAARRILIDRVQWLFQKGRQQRNPLRNTTNQHQTESQSTHYDYDDAQ